MARPIVEAISPSFIVSDVEKTISFYRGKLGFETRFQQPEQDPFFAILGRDGAQIFVKAERGILPVPNNTRHRHLRLDAFVYVPDPDALAAEFAENGATFSEPLKDTSDGLRGFEITDPDGYVLFFGRPASSFRPLGKHWLNPISRAASPRSCSASRPRNVAHGENYMNSRHLISGMTAVLCGAAISTAFAQSGSQKVATAQREILVQTTQSWNGKAYTHYPTGQPQLTTIKMTIAPHTALPWHSHPFPNSVYVLSGTLTLHDRDSGKTLVVHQGQAVGESVDDVHRGESGDEPTVLLITYARHSWRSYVNPSEGGEGGVLIRGQLLFLPSSTTKKGAPYLSATPRQMREDRICLRYLSRHALSCYAPGTECLFHFSAMRFTFCENSIRVLSIGQPHLANIAVASASYSIGQQLRAKFHQPCARRRKAHSTA